MRTDEKKKKIQLVSYLMKGSHSYSLINIETL